MIESRARRCPPAEILLEGNLILEPYLVSAYVIRYRPDANFETNLLESLKEKHLSLNLGVGFLPRVPTREQMATGQATVATYSA